MSKHIMIHDKQ